MMKNRFSGRERGWLFPLLTRKHTPVADLCLPSSIINFDSPIPYSYVHVIFLTILVLHRLWRITTVKTEVLGKEKCCRLVPSFILQQIQVGYYCHHTSYVFNKILSTVT